MALLLVPLFQHLNCLCELRRGLGLQTWSPVPLLYPIEWVLFPVSYFCIQAVGFALLKQGFRAAVTWHALVIAIPVLVVGVALFFKGAPPFRCYLDGFQKRVKSMIDVKELETWGDSMAGLNGAGQPLRELRGKDKPEIAAKFTGMRTPTVLVYFNTNRTPQYALLAWGGGFSRHGLFISIDGRSPLGDKDFNFVPWSTTNRVYFFVSGGR